mgnify:FL=1
MEIKVLGTGCSKCKATYETVNKVVKENNINATVTKVEDIMEIMKYNVMNMPAIVIDGKVVLSGKTPGEKEIKSLLGI